MQSLHITCEGIVHQLHEDPQSLFKVISLNDFENSSILTAHAHDANLIDDDLTFHIILWLNEFKSTNKPILLSLDFEHFSEAALTQFADNIIEFTWISGHDLCVILKRSQKL